MKRFLVVTHRWFVDCKGFTAKEVDGSNYESVKNEADAECHRTDPGHMANIVIELDDNQGTYLAKLNKIPKPIRWFFGAL